MCIHFPQHASPSLCFTFLRAPPFFHVKLEMFVRAKSSDGRGCMKQSSPVLDHATILTLQCSLSGLCQVVLLSCAWVPLLQESFAEKCHIFFWDCNLCSLFWKISRVFVNCSSPSLVWLVTRTYGIYLNHPFSSLAGPKESDSNSLAVIRRI